MSGARGLALAGAGVAATVIALLFAGWLAPGNVLAFWTLVSFCR